MNNIQNIALLPTDECHEMKKKNRKKLCAVVRSGRHTVSMQY